MIDFLLLLIKIMFVLILLFSIIIRFIEKWVAINFSLTDKQRNASKKHKVRMKNVMAQNF